MIYLRTMLRLFSLTIYGYLSLSHYNLTRVNWVEIMSNFYYSKTEAHPITTLESSGVAAAAAVSWLGIQ